ncbi:molybdopterin-dependent oxidoreductase [Chelatococcus sp. SYSU_G07232]|uniref:Molybdopterin-dependent oxidoreductase n=1 Tax=Chelatococcus albus TaxID=3047466 RepID=A0ABT7ACA2_9HYPH|nr:nitrate reductase [Chelatococcus sp. SYSU_G07232]MDJ1156995.1 molybdopterin-dependent oxidoreductase [Chelatococcus sp. SYSU_G07232]
MGETARTVRTTCPYCGTGCGVKARVAPDGSVSIEGDPDHPANFGRLCVKGAALGETLGIEGRLLHPEIGGRRASWDEALDLVAARFAATIAEHGPDSVALYLSGQILTEDYYIANKLMKGFIGTANIDTNSRLCMASSVAGHKRAFGTDTVPNAYEDLEKADLVVLVGSNLAWCHPILFQRLSAAKADRPGLTVVTVDPRRTATSEISDLHLGLAPGSDVALFAGLLRHLEANGRRDADFVGRHTSGLDAALAAAEPWTVAAVATTTGLDEAAVAHFYALFAAIERVVTVYSQGVNQSSAGTDKVNAILNCHLLTGRIGREGSGPFSVTGQPNAMGGREVGGLANQLACHMEIADPAHRALVQAFWQAPRMAERPGLKAVELFEAVAQGRVKAVWIMGTNPVDSLPDADAVRTALAACPFVVVSDVMRTTDTTALAHVLLPAQAWSEKDGTVTNSERRISRQRAFRAPPGEARPDWWALAAVARRLGFGAAFSHESAAEIFAEHAALSGRENGGTRDFDISALAGIDRAGYDALAPFQWPWRAGEAATAEAKRFFANGRFYTSDGRARLVPTPFRAPAATVSEAFPFVLNTGRVRDQWHTMTRTGVAPRLSQHIAEPYVELAPEDAGALGIAPAALVSVTSPRGLIVARALVTERQRRGSVFVPIHWTDQFAGNARVDALVAPVTDPLSGQPELKASVARVAPWPATWYGFALATQRPDDMPADYWALARTGRGWRMELAGLDRPADWEALARVLLDDRKGEGLAFASYCDATAGGFRALAMRDGRVVGLLIAAREPVTASRDWLCSSFAAEEPVDVLGFLAGRPGGGCRDQGRKICVCFDVGAATIEEAIRREGLGSVDEVGRATGAGTGCGSCRPEISTILARQAAKEAAAAST